jgi:anti-anti-sigma regulatory factor
MDVTGDATCRVNVADGGDGSLSLLLVGEFDEFSSSRLVEVAETLADRVAVDLRIDASGVTFASSAMVGALLRLHRVTTGGGGLIGFTAISPTLFRVLEVTSLTPLFDGQAKP